MVPSTKGLVPGSDLAARFRKLLARSPGDQATLKDINWTITEMRPLLDSANMMPANWENLADHCKQSENQAMVIVQGTDTLAYTASALAFLLSSTEKTIIISGAQKPLEAEHGDAAGNLIGALVAARDAKFGVWVYFDKQLLPASRVVKKDALNPAGFAAPRRGLGSAPSNNTPLKWQAKTRNWSDLNIPVVHFTPGEMGTHLDTLIAADPQAIILSLYGLGTLPDRNAEVLGALAIAQSQDVVVVAISQSYIGQIDFSVYATGSKLAKLGVISGRDMTLEAAYTKLMVLFRMGYSRDEIRALLPRPIANELSP